MAGEPHVVLLVADTCILVMERKVLVRGLLHLAKKYGSTRLPINLNNALQK